MRWNRKWKKNKKLEEGEHTRKKKWTGQDVLQGGGEVP